MLKICLDTSFLITLSDPSRPAHNTALKYFEHCIRNKHTLFLSSIVISEFEIKQAIEDLPLENTIILPFNIRHAKKAGALKKWKIDFNKENHGNARAVVENDICIIAQADIEECSIILSEDSNSMKRWSDMFRDNKQINLHVLLMKNGFKPDELENPMAPQLNLKWSP